MLTLTDKKTKKNRNTEEENFENKNQWRKKNRKQVEKTNKKRIV